MRGVRRGNSIESDAVSAASDSALVTGATGFIGGHLARHLLRSGWRTRVLVREPARLPADVRAIAEIAMGHLGDADSLRAAVKDVAVVFHCAANVRTWDSWQAYRDVNVSGVGNLIAAVAAANPRLARLVHFSSVDVYGFPEQPCDEECPSPALPFAYCDTKREGEALVHSQCRREGLPYTVLRPANVIGPGSQFVARIGAALHSGVMLTIDGGRANAGLLQVDNLSDWALWAARTPLTVGRIYNVRDAYDVTWAEFVRELRRGIGGRGYLLDLPFALADAVGAGLETLHRVVLPTREPLLHRLLVRYFGRTCGHSAARLHAESSFVGRIGFEEAMAGSIRWFCQQRLSRAARG